MYHLVLTVKTTNIVIDLSPVMTRIEKSLIAKSRNTYSILTLRPFFTALFLILQLLSTSKSNLVGLLQFGAIRTCPLQFPSF